MSNHRTVHRVCPFCESTCGLAIKVKNDAIVSVRGDSEDPFSRGFICPKAHGVKELYHDPDRLRQPVRRTASGWEEISWEEAYAEVASRLSAIRQQFGKDAIGMYMGNPIIHDLAFFYLPVLARTLGSRNVFNPGAVDTLPKEVQTGLMFGRPFPVTVPIPDIDRTGYLLIVGANPAVSHGSIMTMPNAPGRLKAVIERGGKVVVIDPRRSETAKLASEHHFIRPSADAAFLLALIHMLFEEGLVKLGAAMGLANGLDIVEAVAREFTPESIAEYCQISATTIRRIARELAAAESAACYGRLGTCVQEFGTLACWGIDLVNILTGNLDRPGGVMFTTPAAPIPALAKSPPLEHGIDLGPLQPRLREVLNTKSGMIELAPPTMTNDIARLRQHIAKNTNGMVLIGRRNLRISNSFMHNLPALVKGPDPCTLQVSPRDAIRIGLTNGGAARITSRVGSVVAPVEVTDDLMPGVVSLPHGWGHDAEGAQLRVAKAHPGVNTNVLTDNQAYDKASGTTVLFGTPVTIEPHPQ